MDDTDKVSSGLWLCIDMLNVASGSQDSLIWQCIHKNYAYPYCQHSENDKIVYRYWCYTRIDEILYLPVLTKLYTSIDEIVYQGKKLAFSEYQYTIWSIQVYNLDNTSIRFCQNCIWFHQYRYTISLMPIYDFVNTCIWFQIVWF